MGEPKVVVLKVLESQMKLNNGRQKDTDLSLIDLFSVDPNSYIIRLVKLQPCGFLYSHMSN